MENKLETILQEAIRDISCVRTQAAWEAFKATLLGPQGSLTACIRSLGAVEPAQRPILGKRINEVKTQVEALLAESLSEIENQHMQAQLGDPIDPTLPGVDEPVGTLHPLTQIRSRIYDIFKSMGFSIADGTEVESEWACFDALNVPLSHPSRSAKDTYYLSDSMHIWPVQKRAQERLLLRTHTSSVQIRTLLEQKPTLKIVSAGRTFRRDTADATHSAMFHQVEALCVDQCVSVVSLKAALTYFLKALFGSNVQIRLRPSFFPFTEPSFEVDILSASLGKLSHQWLEILGCGRVHPRVFQNVDLDPKQWSGYALGLGLERVAMILYGVDDIRHFYQNDLSFLQSLA